MPPLPLAQRPFSPLAQDQLPGTHLNEYALISGNYYRYYRYLTPSGAPGGIADLEFVGKYRPGVVGQACPVIINPPGGLYDQPVRVRLSSLTSDATLYYTLDGSTPTTSSMPYAGPIVIGSNRTLRAIAVSPDLTNSRVTSGAFYVPGTIVSNDQLNETSRGGIDCGPSPARYRTIPSQANGIGSATARIKSASILRAETDSIFIRRRISGIGNLRQ